LTKFTWPEGFGASNYARASELPPHLALIAVLIAELGSHGLDYRKAMAKVEVAPKNRVTVPNVVDSGGDRQTSLNSRGEVSE